MKIFVLLLRVRMAVSDPKSKYFRNDGLQEKPLRQHDVVKI